MAETRKRDGEEGAPQAKRMHSEEDVEEWIETYILPCGDLFYATYKDRVDDDIFPRLPRCLQRAMSIVLSYQWEDDHTLLLWNMFDDTAKLKTFSYVFRNLNTLPICSFKILSALLECLSHPSNHANAYLLKQMVCHPFMLAHWKKALDVIPMHLLEHILLRIEPPNDAHQYHLIRKVFTCYRGTSCDIFDFLRKPWNHDQLFHDQRFFTILSWIADDILLDPICVPYIEYRHLHIVGTEILNRLKKKENDTAVEEYFSTKIAFNRMNVIKLDNPRYETALVVWAHNLYVLYTTTMRNTTVERLEQLAKDLQETVPGRLWNQTFSEGSLIVPPWWRRQVGNRTEDELDKFDIIFAPRMPKGAME